MFTKEKCPITFRKVQESALKKGNCNCCDRFFNHVFVGCNKGDQIGRIFAYWPLCIFLKNTKVAPIFGYFFPRYCYVLILTKNGLGHPWGDLYQTLLVTLVAMATCNSRHLQPTCIGWNSK
jgi:hypothetical protein